MFRREFGVTPKRYFEERNGFVAQQGRPESDPSGNWENAANGSVALTANRGDAPVAPVEQKRSREDGRDRRVDVT